MNAPIVARFDPSACAKTHGQDRAAPMAGFTMLEMSVVATVISALTVLILQSITNLSATQAFTRAQMQLDLVTDNVGRAIERDVENAFYCFTDNAEGNGYVAALAGVTNHWVGNSKLPVNTDLGSFDLDPVGQVQTGNALFLAIDSGSLVMTVSGIPVRVDLVRFLVYYMAKRGDDRLDLVRWVSRPLALRTNVEQLGDSSEQQNVRRELHDAGVVFEWMPSAPKATGLFRINSDGVATILSVSNFVEVDRALVQTNILASRHVEIARAGTTAAHKIPRFARASIGDFPSGFEVKIDGPAQGRLTLVRLVLTTSHGSKRSIFAEDLRYVQTAK